MKKIRIAAILGLVFMLLMVSACADSPEVEEAEPLVDEAAEEEPMEADAEEEQEEVDETEPEEEAEEQEPEEETFASEEGDLIFSGFAAEVIDPAIATDEDEDLLTVSGHVYSRLVEMVDGEIVPGLASSWSVSDDALTYEFVLRPNAVFSDGTKVTSDVIQANFNRWFDPENPMHGDDSGVYVAWKAVFGGFRGEMTEEEAPISTFDGIEKVDDLVFLVHLNVPMDDFVEVISSPEFSILNPIMMASEGADHATMSGSVVGTGEYQVAAWDEKGLSLVFSETYWGK